MADLLKIGEKAPDFSLKDQSGREIRLRDFSGKQNVILYFYPKDDTPGCTKEACYFRDHLSSLNSMETQVLGVSVDSIDSHKKFAEKFTLTFPLLSDTEKKISQDYGALNEKGYDSRITYLIDKQGIIRNAYPIVKVDEHVAELQQAIQALAARVQ